MEEIIYEVSCLLFNDGNTNGSTNGYLTFKGGGATLPNQAIPERVPRVPNEEQAQDKPTYIAL